jgi:hypothetical protein
MDSSGILTHSTYRAGFRFPTWMVAMECTRLTKLIALTELTGPIASFTGRRRASLITAFGLRGTTSLAVLPYGDSDLTILNYGTQPKFRNRTPFRC